MTNDAPKTIPEKMDKELLCYCTNLTIGEFRKSLCENTWPLPEKENTGLLCTGCFADFLYCKERLKKNEKQTIP